MDKNRYTIMIGARDTIGLPAKALLIAPQFCGVRVGDYVMSQNGFKYKITFVDEYCELDGVLATGLMVALGMEPQKITKRVFEETVKWDDYKEEEEEEERENDDTV
jgi:hypothetical protein